MAKKRVRKPCGLCCLCDLARFVGWRRRIEAGLSGSTVHDSPRFVLIQEIHDDVARRYPLGIAVRLSSVIEALAYSSIFTDDEEAIHELENLEDDETESFRLNGDSVACPSSIAAYKTRKGT